MVIFAVVLLRRGLKAYYSNTLAFPHPLLYNAEEMRLFHPFDISSVAGCG